MDAWAHVHENILHAIFAILDIRQAARCALVCRGWRDAVRRAPTLDLSAERDKVARSAVHWLAWNGFGGSNLATIRIPRAVFVPAVEALDLSIVCNNLKTSALSMWADSVAEVRRVCRRCPILNAHLLRAQTPRARCTLRCRPRRCCRVRCCSKYRTIRGDGGAR